jgi:hypothetical protein
VLLHRVHKERVALAQAAKHAGGEQMGEGFGGFESAACVVAEDAVVAFVEGAVTPMLTASRSNLREAMQVATSRQLARVSTFAASRTGAPSLSAMPSTRTKLCRERLRYSGERNQESPQ